MRPPGADTHARHLEVRAPISPEVRGPFWREIRIRDDRRLGELMAALAATVGLAKGGRDQKSDHRARYRRDTAGLYGLLSVDMAERGQLRLDSTQAAALVRRRRLAGEPPRFLHNLLRHRLTPLAASRAGALGIACVLEKEHTSISEASHVPGRQPCRIQLHMPSSSQGRANTRAFRMPCLPLHPRDHRISDGTEPNVTVGGH